MKISSFHIFSPTFLLYHPGNRDVVGGILSALRAGQQGIIVRFSGDAIGVLPPKSESKLGPTEEPFLSTVKTVVE